eukprot:359211-Chlamydomonas_euryale.AAC.11
MVFVLSAVSPERMPAALANVARLLKPGTGRLLFRDYGRGDLAQDKHQAGAAKKLGENFYVRGDGTRCYYFDGAELPALFAPHGLLLSESKLHARDVDNHKRQITMHRRWVQAVFTRCMDGGACTAGPAGGCMAAPSTQPPPQGGGDAMDMCEEDTAPAPGTWLVGAAGRLVSGVHSALPGGPRAHAAAALLPDTLDSADEVAHALRSASSSSAGTRGGGGGGGGSAGPCGAGQAPLSPLLAARAVEAELEAEFFATVRRDTRKVVEEEVAAAAARVATIRLVEPGEAGDPRGVPLRTAEPAKAAATAALVQPPREQQQQAVTGLTARLLVPGTSLSWALPAGVPVALLSATLAGEVALASAAVAAAPRLFSGRCVTQLCAGGSGVVAMTLARSARR